MPVMPPRLMSARLMPAVRELAGVSRLLVLRGGGVAATFLMNLLIVRRFGAETNGLFQVALSYVMIGAAVGRLGQEQLALRDIAAIKVGGDAGRARAAIDRSLAVTLPAALAVALSVAVAADIWGADGGGMIPAFTPTIILLAWLWIVTEALRGWQLVLAAIFWQGSFIPIAFVALFVPLDALGLLRAGGLPWLYAGCSLVGLAGAGWAWRRAISASHRPAAAVPWRHAVRDTVRRGAMFWILAILTNVAGWLDLLVLYAFADAAVVGIFQPIVRTGGLIAVAINIATAGLIARLALLYAARDGAAFVRIARLYWIAIAAGSLAAGAVFIAMAPWIAALWGPAIAPYHRELTLYVLVQLAQAIFIIAPLAAPVMGLERAMVVVQIANVPLKAAAVALGYAQAGLAGVIAGLGLCTLVSVSWTVLLFFRQLATMGIRWQSFLTGRP